jgi:transposase InsO family protein
VSRFRFVSEHRGAFGVKRLCRVLEVSRSGFYAWECRLPSAGAVRDAELGGLIVEVHQRSRRTYGAPRVHAELRHLDQRCSRKRVARLMRDARPGWARARRRWRRGRPDVAPAPDLVNRRFDPPGPDRVWAADVTQFRTGEGWLYLAGVIDLYSRRVVGWAMSNRPDTDLVTDALVMALSAPTTRPAGRASQRPRRGLHVAGVQPPPRRVRTGPIVRLARGRLRQRRGRSLLGDAQARARLDPPAHHLGQAPSSAPPCSTTSKPSTTPSASNSASATTALPPTRQAVPLRRSPLPVVPTSQWSPAGPVARLPPLRRSALLGGSCSHPAASSTTDV